jgi:tetratricopeptide (TPR) repeat protein
MRARTIALWLLLLAGPAALPALAQGLSLDWERCVNAQQVFSFGEQVAGCTAVIEGPAEAPENLAMAHYNRGYGYHNSGELPRAMADYSRALELDPAHASAWHNRGIGHAEQGDLSAALADFGRAVALDPGKWETREARGMVLAALGDHAAARADFSEAIRLTPYTAGPYAARLFTRRGQAALDQRDYDAAIGDFGFAIQTTVFADEARLGRATANFALKRWQLAFDDLNLFIERRPEVQPAWTLRCLAGAALDRPKTEVLGDCLHGMALAPASPGALEGLGKAALKYGEWQEALGLFEDGLAQYPNRAALLYGRGVARARLGMTDEGWDDIVRATGIDPGVPLDFADFGVVP